MESQSLIYKISPPVTAVSGPPPALILLHGRGTDENDLIDLSTNFDSRLFTVSIRAPIRYQYSGYTWFDLDGDGSIDPTQLLAGCNGIIRTVDDISSKYKIDKEKIFLFGFSMGAMMSLAVSLMNPGKFRGVAAHSGMLPQIGEISSRPGKLNTTSYFIAHGRFDPVVPAFLGRQAYDQLKESIAKIIFKEYPIQHTISEESLSDIAAWLHELLQ